ncbi:MAG: hypothetical protein ACKVJX_16745 [Verrucomicrobiia bacterium]|mgnify:CR=1 FL=1|jgi:hypothetical protein
MPPTPTQSTPGGCVVATFGLFAWAYTALYGFLAVKAGRSDTLKEKSEIITNMSWHAGISFVVGLTLIWVGYRMAMGVGGYDSRDSNEPMMKF